MLGGAQAAVGQLDLSGLGSDELDVFLEDVDRPSMFVLLSKFTAGLMRKRAALATFASFETNAPLLDDFLGVAIVLLQAIRDFLRVERPNGDATIIETLHDFWILQRLP